MFSPMTLVENAPCFLAVNGTDGIWVKTCRTTFLNSNSDESKPEVFSLIYDTFCAHDQMKDRAFSYLMVNLSKKINLMLFPVVFRFEANYKSALDT